MHRAYLTRNTDRVRVTGTPSPGSVAPASFINTVDRVNPSTWSRFPVCGNNNAKLVKNFLLENVSFFGESKSETALEIDKTKVCIIDSSFMHNTVGSLRGPTGILQNNNNQHAYYVGGAIIVNQSSVAIIRSEFFENRAEIGGAIFATQGSKIVIKNSSFVGNRAVDCSQGTCFGGVLYTEQTTIVISESDFSNSTATNGGFLSTFNSTVSIISCKIYNNMAESLGGAMFMQAGSKLKIDHTEIYNNQALRNGGGVAYMMGASSLSINASKVHNNLASTSGGVILANGHCFLINMKSLVYNNSAQQWIGGVIAALSGSKEVYSDSETTPLIGIYDSVFESNKANHTGGVFNIEYGNNLTILRSSFINNLANIGGGVFESDRISITIVDANFIQNQALEGGAIRLLQSKIIFGGFCNLINNSGMVGGAMYALESALRVTQATIVAEQNEVFAVRNAHSFQTYDGTYCFIQVTSHGEITDFSKFISLIFTDNISHSNGSVLYGGLLDRCTISNTFKYYLNPPDIDRVAYFRNISNLTNQLQADLISSDPVSLCFCSPNGEPDCEYQLPFVQVKKGEAFNISLVAVDHIKHVVPQREIYTQLKHRESGLGDGQVVQKTRDKINVLI